MQRELAGTEEDRASAPVLTRTVQNILVTYRTWLLYLAAAGVGFESGQTDLYQVLLAKRGPRAPGD